MVYTSLLNEAGGIKADLTITQVDENTYWVLTGVGSGPQDLAWIQQHAPDNDSVSIRDLSSHYTAIDLWGPNARRTLQKLTNDDVSDEAFPYFRAKRLNIGVVPALALRVSYAGELGWEIYCASETRFGLVGYAVGSRSGIRHHSCGSRLLRLAAFGKGLPGLGGQIFTPSTLPTKPVSVGPSSWIRVNSSGAKLC